MDGALNNNEVRNGGLSERLKEPVLKTGDGGDSTVSSNLTPAAMATRVVNKTIASMMRHIMLDKIYI